jgi:hypothetical protein
LLLCAVPYLVLKAKQLPYACIQCLRDAAFVTFHDLKACAKANVGEAGGREGEREARLRMEVFQKE